MTQLAPTRAASRLHPTCPDCDARMTLFGIESHPTIGGTHLLTYACSTCDAVETETVMGQVTPIGPLVAEKAFDPETTHVLGAAFDAAWERIEATNTVPMDKARAASLRELLAKFIISAVDQGTTDPQRIVEKAILRVNIILRHDIGVSGNG